MMHSLYHNNEKRWDRVIYIGEACGKVFCWAISISIFTSYMALLNIIYTTTDMELHIWNDKNPISATTYITRIQYDSFFTYYIIDSKFICFLTYVYAPCFEYLFLVSTCNGENQLCMNVHCNKSRTCKNQMFWDHWHFKNSSH